MNAIPLQTSPFQSDFPKRIATSPFQSDFPKRIAIVRALPGLGDLLCTVPAFRALRAAFPTAQITLIGLPWAKGFVQRFGHYLDRWVNFPGFPGIPEVALSSGQTASFLMQMQSSQLDLALQMHGNGSHMNSFTLLLGAKVNAGFFPKGHFCPNTNYWLPYPETEPEVWRHLKLLEFLDIPLQGDYLEFPLTQLDWEAWKTLTSAYQLHPGNYICIHPGASVSSRCWRPEYFAAVADALAGKGHQIVLTGTTSEASLVQTIIQMMRYPVINLAGKTSLGSMAVLLKNARLLICNDTGVSHLAAALQVKSVVIFSNSELHRWAPLDRKRHRAVGGYCDEHMNEHINSYAEQNCSAASYPTPDVVLTEAEDLLQEEFVYAS